jgi:hypothetical protein
MWYKPLYRFPEPQRKELEGTLNLREKGLEGTMEVAELRTLIDELGARVENIRDWL